MKRGLIALILPISIMIADTKPKDITLDKNQTENNITIIKRTTIGHYQKPGAPVDMTYSTTKVKVGEVSDVNITFKTPLKSGDMDITITLDKELKSINEESFNHIVFPITEEQNDYNINLRVTSKSNGLFYIRFLIKIENDKDNSSNMRVFAVPVYIGSGKLNKHSKQQLMKAFNGENISISKAEETIELLEE